MNTGSGDTLGVAADTLNLPAPQEEFSLGRIIPLFTSDGTDNGNEHPASSLSIDHVAGLRRIDGEARTPGLINTDVSFVLLSLSLMIITILAVFFRKSMISGLTSISFRRHGEVNPPGTSEVFSWPPILRNIFTVINISLFASITVITMGLAVPGLFGGSTGLTAVIAGVFLAALLIRHLITIILAEITRLQNLYREYMNIVYNTWFACAIFMFIINTIILFAPVGNPSLIIKSGLIIVAIVLTVRALRLLSIFIDRHVSIFYYILYLCALEVLPVLVIFKLLGAF
jgi:hypothetical protein